MAATRGLGGGRFEVRVLGPLELVVGGQVQRVAGGAERALIALLALAGGRVVSKDRAIDSLWGVALPANPMNALHLRVSKLRKLLGPALVAEAPGYRLDLVPDEVDALRFARLVAERRFDEALALWRGEPLQEFIELPFASAEAARLVELRATALEEHMDVRLAAGEHAALVGELEALVSDRPLRERLRGQLMLALYRSGRAADALDAFQDLRRVLDEELGLAPSVALQRLQEAILRQDASLEGVAGPAGSSGNLPNLVSTVIGRDDDLERLLALSARSRLVTLTGPGGAGKTTLALAAAHRLAGDLPDGAWFVPLTRVADVDGVAAAVSAALGLVDPDAAAAERLVTAWLGPRRTLLVLDNCEHVIDAAARFAEQLLRAAGDGLRVLTTSREALGVPGELLMPVAPLAPEDALALFVERAQAVRPDLDLIADDEATVRDICQQLDFMPLAIELAAARVKALTLADIAGRLRDRFALLTSGHRTAEQRHRTLRATVEWSYDLLTSDEQVLFRRLAVFAGGWTLPAAEQVCGDGLDATVLDLLGHLVDRSLVIAQVSRFRMLETIRAYASALLAEHQERPALQQRHAVAFTAFAEEAEPRLRGSEQRRWLALLRADEPNLSQALAWAREHADELPDLGVRLAASLGWYWYVGRQVDGRAELTATLQAAPAAAPDIRARALQALSLAVRPAGCIVHPSPAGAAAARESLEALEAAGDLRRAALSRLLLAVEAVADGDVAGQLAAVEEARQQLEADGDAWGVALADFIEMEIELYQDSVERALAVGARSADRFDALADEWGQSAVRLHLGVGLRLAGRTAEADEALEQVVQISRDTGLPNNLARAFVELGECAAYRGEPDAADRWLAEAHQLSSDLANDALLALVALARGAAARLRDDAVGAAMRYREALDLAVASGVARSRVRARVGLAAASLDAGPTAPADVANCAAAAAEAVEEARALGDPAVLASALEQAARLATVQADGARRNRLLAEAAALRDRHARPSPAVERRDVERLTTAHAAATS